MFFNSVRKQLTSNTTINKNPIEISLKNLLSTMGVDKNPYYIKNDLLFYKKITTNYWTNYTTWLYYIIELISACRLQYHLEIIISDII